MVWGAAGVREPSDERPPETSIGNRQFRFILGLLNAQEPREGTSERHRRAARLRSCREIGPIRCGPTTAATASSNGAFDGIRSTGGRQARERDSGGMNRHSAFWALLAICAFFALGAEDDSCSTEESGGGGNGSAKEEKSGGGSAKRDDNCGTTATDDCTPHVGPNGTVLVDALLWRITGAQRAASLGDTGVGLGEDADGVFIVVNLRVTSKKSEPATITDEAIRLEAPNGNAYKADLDGTVAAIGQGQDPLFLADIGPDATLQSKVVFDVPRSVANRKLEVRFGELGFGSTHGYIRLPTRTGAGPNPVAGQGPGAGPSGRAPYIGRSPGLR